MLESLFCMGPLKLTQQTFLVLQDVFKTSWRRLQRNNFRLPRHLQDVFAIRLPKTSSRHLARRLQDVFKTSSRRVCKTSCNYVFKMSWKTKKSYTEDVFKTSSRRLQYVLTKRMFAGVLSSREKMFFIIAWWRISFFI